MSDPEDDELFEITVWTWTGDVVKKIRRATVEDIDRMEEQYPIEEGFTVAVEPLA